MSSEQNWEQKYSILLAEFNQYREKIVNQKENQLREFEKYRAHIDKTYKQMQKKFDQKLQEERLSNEKKCKKMEAAMKLKLEQHASVLENKNRFIEQLKRRLGQHEAEKHQIIEDHTRMLYELCEDMENSEQVFGPGKNSYQDLVRLYQFVLEENNNLKKQLFRVELKNKDIVQEDSKLLQPKAPLPTKQKQKQQRKKKKTTVTSMDNSKLHNESIRPKTTQQGPPRKDMGKRQ